MPEKEKISFTDEIAQIFANARSAVRGEWNEPKSTIETTKRRSYNPPTELTQSTHTPPIEPTLSKDKIMETQSHQKSNAPMYDRTSLPSELTDAIAQEFGKAKINTPKENGTYRGEVHELKGYLVQEVGSRSLVVHDKSTLDFKGSTQNANDNKKLDGWDVQIFYGDKDKRAGVYTHDPEKEAFNKAVKNLKITANQQGKGEFAKELGKVAESAWEKTVEFRKQLQKKSEPEKPSEPQAAKAAPAAEKKEKSPKR